MGRTSANFIPMNLAYMRPKWASWPIFLGTPPLADTPANAPRSDSKPVIIPEDMADGMLIHKVDPEYPAKAKDARISGIVILKATISKTGEILDLHAECGPGSLQEPSLKAVRE